MKIPRIIKGSILDFEGDAIVNPANSFLNHAGGLAGVIAKAAGAPLPGDNPFRPTFWEQDHFRVLRDGPIATGDARVTTAGALPYKGVIHAVGPIWGGGHFLEASLLMLAHSSALTCAETRGWQSVAFPAISCGVFGYPVEQAAHYALRALSLTSLDVSVYLMDDAHVAAYKAASQQMARGR